MKKINEFEIDGKRGVVQSCHKEDHCMKFNVGVELGGILYQSGIFDYEKEAFSFDHPSEKKKKAETVQSFIVAHSSELLPLFEKLNAL